MSQQPQHLVVTSTKSTGMAILLTVLFGPLGMFYSTIVGALVMIPVSIVFSVITLGLGLIITWPICIIWAAIATKNYNEKLLSGSGGA